MLIIFSVQNRPKSETAAKDDSADLRLQLSADRRNPTARNKHSRVGAHGSDDDRALSHHHRRAAAAAAQRRQFLGNDSNQPPAAAHPPSGLRTTTVRPTYGARAPTCNNLSPIDPHTHTHTHMSTGCVTNKKLPRHQATASICPCTFYSHVSSVGYSGATERIRLKRAVSLLLVNLALAFGPKINRWTQQPGCRRSSCVSNMVTLASTIFDLSSIERHTKQAVGRRPPQYIPLCDLDLWPFDLESGVLVTCDVGYLCANFSLPRPLCSRLRPDVRDRQMSDRQTSESIIA